MREQIEALQDLYEAFNRRDWDRALAAFAPDAEWQELDVPDAAVHRGHAEIRAWWENLMTVAPDFHAEPRRFVEAGDEIVVLTGVTGTGRESGLDLDGRVAMTWAFRGGEIVRCVVRRDLDEALAAAGVSDSGV